MQNFNATYYDDLLTYDLRLYYYSKTGGKNSVIITPYIDFEVKLVVLDAGKDYISTNGTYVNVLKASDGAISSAIRVTIGKDTRTRALTTYSYDLSADANYIEVKVDDQYYEDFNDQPTFYKPLAVVNIKPNGVKRLFAKTYETIPVYTNNGRDTTNNATGTTATITIDGDNGVTTTNSIVKEFKIKNIAYKTHTITIKHQNRNGIKIAEDNVIVLDAGTIYTESLMCNGKLVKDIIAENCLASNNNLSTNYLPNRAWVEGVLNQDTEYTIVYNEYDVWDGTYYADKVTQWKNAATAELKLAVEKDVYDGGDGS